MDAAVLGGIVPIGCLVTTLLAAVGERSDGPVFLAPDRPAAGPARRGADCLLHRPPRRDRQARWAARAAARVHHRGPRRRVSRCGRCRKPLHTPLEIPG